MATLLALADPLLLLTLFFLAFTQPLLSLLSHQAEFFIARVSEPNDIYTFVAVLVLAPLLVAVALALLRRLHDALGMALHAVLAAVLFALVVLLAIHPTVASPAGLAVAAVAGCGAAILFHRNADLRAMVAYSSPLVMLWLAWSVFSFLWLSPVHRIVERDINRNVLYTSMHSTAPVVFIIFDEMPLSTLLNSKGGIDDGLFPNFARLARQSTWYRRTSTVADLTEQAVPGILSGTRPTLDKVAVCADYPHNLFTLFGGTYGLVCMESGTRLVPPGQERNLLESYTERMRAMARDLWLVYEHLVVPHDLEPRLTDVSHQWREFGVATDRRSYTSRPRSFERFEDHIQNATDRVLYYHHADLPHYPYEYLPNGAAYDTSSEVVAEGLVPQAGSEHDAWSTDDYALSAYQRHLVQCVLCDRLLGQLLDRLQRVGLYDKSLIVVTSDHGACFRGHLSHRRIGPENFMDIGPVPFFLKAPGQTAGRIEMGRVETIDILPTIAATLHQTLPWPVEGQAEPRSSLPIAILGHADNEIHRSEWDESRFAAIIAYKEKNFGASGGPERLFRMGPHPELLGQKPAPASAAPGDVVIDWEQLLAKVDPGADFLPNRVRGTASGGEAELAVALNGVVRGTTRTSASGDFSCLLDPQFLTAGANHVDIYRIGADGLHPVHERTRETYTLSGTKLTSSDGKQWTVGDASVIGHVDMVVQLEGSLLVQGWAGADNLLFFSGDRFLMAGTPGWQIDWKGKGLGPDMAGAGFSYTIPLNLLKGAESEPLRVIAVKGTAAAEIPTGGAATKLPVRPH